MPTWALKLAATLDNVDSLTVSSDEYSFHVRFQCESCRETFEKFSVFTWADQMDVPGGRGVANLGSCARPCELSSAR
jgi:hypothetical protein